MAYHERRPGHITAARSGSNPGPDVEYHGFGRLPRVLTSFIGRREEVATIREMIMRDDVRLLTLTGPGGAGKTRLAVEVATHLPESVAEDIWFVSLSTVHDPELVVQTIAQAMGVTQVRDGSAEDTLIRFLRDRRTLLIIDNFETVIPAGPRLTHILAACPLVTMLVTSRTVLRISGEHVVSVPPLALPDADRLHPVEHVRTFDAVRLFTERARASASSFGITEDNAATIVAICRRLDGLPLALELAAARIAFMSPNSLLHLLEHQLTILSSGPQDAPQRHRSMRETISWSYDLLPEDERTSFRRLAVFSGGFSPDAAAAVADEPGNILDVLTSLAAKNLIVPTPLSTEELRFTMLETLREYGLERLEEAGELPATRDRHAAWCLEEAARSEYAWLMPLKEGARLVSRLAMNRSNMREALDWLFRSGDITSALHLAGMLGTLWIMCGHANEGRTWLEQLLALTPHRSDQIYATALATLSWLGNQQGMIEEAFRLAEEALEITRSLDAPFMVTRCLVLSGVAAGDLGTLELAKERLEAAMQEALALDGPEWWQNWVVIQLTHLGYTALIEGHIEEAEARFQDAVNRQIARGYAPGTSHLYGYMVLAGLGRASGARGDLVRALYLFQQSLDFSRRFSRMNVSIVNHSIRAISLIAGTLAGLGQTVQATRLFGASSALQEMYSYHFAEASNLQRAFGIPPHLPPHDATSGRLHTPDVLPGRDWSTRPRVNVPSHILVQAWDEGQALSLEEAIAEAIAATAETDESSVLHDLTPRQIEVLRLVAEGDSNREIAERLSLSERTVEHHVEHILDRLGLESRTAAASYAVRKGLL